jgi:hypothetical protein
MTYVCTGTRRYDGVEVVVMAESLRPMCELSVPGSGFAEPNQLVGRGRQALTVQGLI